MAADPRHAAGVREDFQPRRMADAALSAVGYVRGVSEPWGVVAEPVTGVSGNYLSMVSHF